MSPYQKSCASCPIWTKSLFQSLPADAIHELIEQKQSLTLKRNQQLFLQGEETRGLFCISAGLIRIEQRGSSEKSRFIRLAVPGDTAGHRSVFVDKAYKGTAAVISESAEACFIPKSVLLSLIGAFPEFALRLVQKIATELDRSEEDRIAIKERTVRSRLAEILLSLAKRYADRTSDNSAILKSELSKVDLARMLSVADETVIRLMTEFKNDGVIEYSDRRIHVLNADRLNKISTSP